MKKFEDFIKENTENKGKGVGGDTDLFPRPFPKQTINKGDLDPIDNLGIRGHQITTDKIDGIVKSVKDGIVYVEDRESKETKEYPIVDFLKEFNKYYKKQKKEEKIVESVELDDKDKELLNKIIYGDKINESKKSERDLWEKKWESFTINNVKATKIDEDDDIVNEGSTPYSETKWGEEVSKWIYDGLKEQGFDADEAQDIIDMYPDFEQMIYDVHNGTKVDNAIELLISNRDSYKKTSKIVSNNYSNRYGIKDEEDQTSKSVDSHGNFIGFDESMKVERFSDFTKRLRVKPNTIDEDLETSELEEIEENAVPKQLPQVKCSDCGNMVTDSREDKIRHLYSKHNFKPTVDEENINDWLLNHFPPKGDDKKK